MKEMWVPLSGAIARQRQVDTLANNVANANTPGFKRDELSFKEYLTVLNKGVEDIHIPRGEWAPKDFYQHQGGENSKVEISGSYTDHSQGQLTPTQNPLDIAIYGKGFFEILTENGVRFTRNGTFTIDNQGQLVTSQGYKVLEKLPPKAENVDPNVVEQIVSPEDRVINVSGAKNFTVTSSGEIFVDNKKVSDLSVVDFVDQAALRKEGNSSFVNPHPKNRLDSATKFQLRQGFVEQSNVNAISEMSKLIKANRNFESIQRVIKAYDHVAGKAVNDLSRF